MAIFFPYIFYLGDMLNSQIFSKHLQCNYCKYNAVSLILSFPRTLKLLSLYQNCKRKQIGYGHPTLVEPALILGPDMVINVKNMYNKQCKFSDTPFKKDGDIGYLFQYFQLIWSNDSKLQFQFIGNSFVLIQSVE